jgi:hypothetical protein
VKGDATCTLGTDYTILIYIFKEKGMWRAHQTARNANLTWAMHCVHGLWNVIGHIGCHANNTHAGTGSATIIRNGWKG